VKVHELSRLDARRIAVRAQLLDHRRPTELLDAIRQLTLLQIDPIAAIAPNADLVAWSRLGSSYSPAELDTALADRTLLELRAMVRPSEDLALYRADMAHWDRAERGERPGWWASQRDWVRANDTCRLDILDRLGSSGPLPSRDLPDTCEVPWRSSGWTNNRNVTQLLEFMVLRGEVAIAGRRGGDRLWDLATRVYPVDVLFRLKAEDSNPHRRCELRFAVHSPGQRLEGSPRCHPTPWGGTAAQLGYRYAKQRSTGYADKIGSRRSAPLRRERRSIRRLESR
jgi:uncharacterized protein YcaQ